jgi:hypothetical protein
MISPASIAKPANPRMRSWFLFYQGLQEPACFRERARPEYVLHRDFEQPVRDAAPFRFRLAQPDTGKFGIREHAGRNLPAGRNVVTATEIIPKYSKIIERDVRKLRTACNLAESPDALRCRFKPLIDLYISAVCELNTG